MTVETQRVLDDIREKIATHGWYGIGVFPTADDPHVVPFNYTIGLTEQGLPELILFGLPGLESHRILGNAIKVLQGRARLADGTTTEHVLKNYKCAFRDLPREAAAKTMTIADRYYRDRPMRMMQLVWPDARRNFPWDRYCDETVATCQSVIIDWRHPRPRAVE